MPDRPRGISPGELDEVLARAREENWQQLALLGPYAGALADWLRDQGWTVERIFLLSNRLGDERARALASLTNLTSLGLWGNRIGAEGACALAALTNLTSLNLSFNDIGDEGACALAALTNLTALDLSFNDIGAEGARAGVADPPHLAQPYCQRHRGRGARALASLRKVPNRTPKMRVRAARAPLVSNAVALSIGPGEFGPRRLGARALGQHLAAP